MKGLVRSCPRRYRSFISLDFRKVMHLYLMIAGLLLLAFSACEPTSTPTPVLPTATPDPLPTPTPVVEPTNAKPDISPELTPTPGPTPENTPIPPDDTPGPEPLTTAEFEEFVDSLCHETHLEVFVENDHETIRLTWDKSPYYGPHTGPRYQDYSLTYRIERMDPDSHIQPEWRESWELVAEVTNQFSWKGDVGPGFWVYQIAIYSVNHAGQSSKCFQPSWHGLEVFIDRPLTDAEVEEIANRLCRDVEIIYLEGEAYWDTVTLFGETNFWELLERELSVAPFHELGISFHTQWQRSGTTTWETADPLHGGNGWDGNNYYVEAEAVPGKVIYSVGIAAITFAEQVYPCQADEVQWREVTVEAPTEEEIAAVAAEREILLAEASRCILESLSENISEEALPIFQKYAASLVSGGFTDYAGPDANQELANHALMLCAMVNNEDGGFNSWAFWMFFGGLGGW